MRAGRWLKPEDSYAIVLNQEVANWFIALPLSMPVGMLLTSGLSAIMGGELSYDYSPAGMLYWLGLVAMLSLMASVLPARGATRVSVRESLAYVYLALS